MPIMKNTAPCGGCGEGVGPVHCCSKFSRHMHPFCGRPTGKEGYGQPVVCPECDRADVSPLNTTSYAATISDRDSDSGVVCELPTQLSSFPRQRSRNPQVVTSVGHRRKAVRWMIQHEAAHGDKGMYAKAVDRYPAIFNSATRAANLAKALDWWKKREKILNTERGAISVSARRRGGRQRLGAKVIVGCGRRRSAWVEWLYPRLLDEFDRLRKLGVKFEPALLLQLAKQILRDSTEHFNSKSVDAGALIIDKITTRCVQRFMEAHQIVIRTQTGKKQHSEAKILHIEKQVAFHLGELQRGFAGGSLDENAIENIDGTHFVVDFDNGKTLGFCGDETVKNADVVSGGEGMTMVVRISGGASAHIHPPMMIFTNSEGNYPIQGVPDKTPGVCYRSSKKGWMTQKLFREYLKERRAIRADVRGRKKTVFLDNCSGHLEASECRAELDAINSDLKFPPPPPNATDLCQPADSFVISKIKDAWKAKWKIALIKDGCWQNKIRKDGSWSGKLQNPGKKFFLQLAAEAVRAVNHQTDRNGMPYARKAMIRCGLSLGLDGTWSIKQLYPHLQEIISKHLAHFDGDPVDEKPVHA